MLEQDTRSEEHTSELQSPCNLVCRLLLEKKKKQKQHNQQIHHRNPQRHAHDHPYARTHCCACLTGASVSHWSLFFVLSFFFFFFNDTATTEIYTLSLHDALPI